MQWISVKDKEPKKWQDVLVSFDKEIATAYWDGSRFIPCACLLENPPVNIDDIKYWMPLPGEPDVI